MNTPVPVRHVRWISSALLPVANLVFAMIATGGVVLLLYWGQFQNGTISADQYWRIPGRAAEFLWTGAFGDLRSVSYTLFYATDFIFAGLAVAVAAHAGLFNIGGEGQAYVAGLAATVVCLKLGFLPGWILIPLAIIAAAAAGAGWALIPAYLQASRGSNMVITTIMFNFIASALVTYFLVHVLIVPGHMSPESARFTENARLPTLSSVAALVGVPLKRAPLNIAFLLACLCSVAMWLLIWRTRWGYAFRTVGFSVRAARYAGISTSSVFISAMCLSGALAGLIAINQVLGAQHRLVLNFVAGAGLVGVAVSLMGRHHPIGVFLASLLFGALYQGGMMLSFQLPEITRDMTVVIQGLIILFTGAFDNVLRAPIERMALSVIARFHQ